jgi:DHA1 family bicyclomycin/chloramphenicol resistance-like MFS transporter
LLLIILPPAGFMSVISISSALAVEIYGYSLQLYGLLFALAGISILAGSTINRFLVLRFDQLTLIGIGVALMAISSAQLLLIAWLDTAPFWWLWGCVCLFMFSIAITMANSMVLALDPLPKVAGVASSIIGTLQNLIGAAGALGAAFIYDGSVRNSVIIMAGVGATVTLLFLLKPLIAPGPFMQHTDEPTRS